MVYEDKVVDVLHNALTTGLFELLNVPYTIPFKLNLAGIRIEIYKEPKLNDMIMGQMVITTDKIDSPYIQVWKTYAPGKFIIRDFRKQIVDADGNSPYYEVYYTHGRKKMKALLRKLIELSDETISDTEKAKLKNDYADIMLNNEYYAIIKICIDGESTFGWITPETGLVDIMHTSTIGHIEGYDIDDVYPEDSDENDSDIEIESFELL